MNALRALGLVLVLPLAAGCVHRAMHISSEPEGALVTIDGRPAGRTPLDVPFTWYGSREIALEKTGCRSITRIEALHPPWWQIFPLDFVTEVLLPVPLEDIHEFRYALEPFEEGGEGFERAKERAAKMKRKAHED